jgi:hypothetical protein
MFNDAFKKNSEGKAYDWRDVEEPEIMKMYENHKKSLLKILNECKLINLPKNLTVLETPSQDSFELNEFLKHKIKDGLI